MDRSRRFKIFLSFFTVFLVAFLTWGYMRYFKKTTVEVEEVLGIQTPTGVPYIVSLPPIVVYEGWEYEYYVKVVDVDTSIEYLSLEYIQGPEWLYLEDFVLKGVAPDDSRGTYKIVLKVSDGYNSSTQEEYILVEEFTEDVQ